MCKAVDTPCHFFESSGEHGNSVTKRVVEKYRGGVVETVPRRLLLTSHKHQKSLCSGSQSVSSAQEAVKLRTPPRTQECYNQ